MCCPLFFEFSVGMGGFVIGLGQISFFFSSCINVHILFIISSFLNVINQLLKFIISYVSF